MKTSPLLNKTIYRVKALKVPHAIKILLGTISFTMLFSSVYKDDSDYTILNQLLQESITRNQDKTVFLDTSRDNRYIGEMIQELRDSIPISSRNNKWPPYGITKDSVFDKIFNEAEYEHIISQTDTGKWDFGYITVPGINQYYKGKKTGNGITLFVSKPAYTKDGQYALVAFAERLVSYVIVYRKSSGKWIQYKTISHMIG